MTSDPLDDLIDAQVEESRRILDFAEGLNDKPVQWGNDDCSAFPAAYLASRGFDIRIPVYSTEAEAQQIVDQYGDLASVWDAIAQQSDLYEIDPSEVQAGDVGVIRVSTLGATHGFQIGVIFIKYGLMAVIRSEDGIRMLSPRTKTIVKVWRPKCRN